MDKAEMPCQALVRMLAKKPGWKETNFQVTLTIIASFVRAQFTVISCNNVAAIVCIQSLISLQHPGRIFGCNS